MKIAITGATGFVGRRLVERLQTEGHELRILSQRPTVAQQLTGCQVFDAADQASWLAAVEGADAVINLAGEPIAEQRWTPAQKQRLKDSRVQTTRALVSAIAAAQQKPAVLVSASAIGYYGTSETAQFSEDSPAGQDYLAEICQAWEQESQVVTASGTRLVTLRIGIVVGPGGAIGKMLGPFKLFAGGPIGSGQQWVSWIQREDLVSLILEAIANPSYQGTYNATAPQPVRMVELSRILGEVLQRPSWLPVPGFALEALLGEGALLVLEGQQVLPKRLETSGFQFHYPDLKSALQQFLP
ncbi:thylakoid membrane protein ThyD [Synechococcus elongatus]|uniref:TIGR01777 family oxidoreductase n=1 Tax=Synechococcus elongatus PCC 11802 TaxID=2283154 RepID=A0AAT9JXV7_SYNEL|nr:TIGR01777 family oxidoreductase [Synechococcus elongatus]QFZ91690.1 TIGR01777 family protein [Synechococcus elongatus PCC 11802]